MHQEIQKIKADWTVMSDGEKLVFMDLSEHMTDETYIIADKSVYTEVQP